MSGERRPTRRGWAVAAVVGLAAVMGWVYGGRSLNAVVVPGVALLAVSWLGVWRASAPHVERESAAYGFPGETPRVEITVESDRSANATVTDAVPEVFGASPRFETVTDGRPLAYSVRLAERGVHELGPVTVRITDVFGLWQKTYVEAVTDEVVVFPRVRPLYDSAGVLSGYVGLTDEREQFDSIREYQRGDALRDVNWKASAKRAGDLVVTEYAGEGAERTVMVGVGSGPNPDNAAEAAATLVTHMLDAGLAVGLATPSARVGPGTGLDHRHELLTALARYDGTGAAPALDGVDLEVVPGEGGATVRTGHETHHFDDIAYSVTSEVAG